MPGGKIAPDGRRPQAPGVGKHAKRHDLERPATPGLHGSDLQQGDVQRLEQAQRQAPRAKQYQPPAQGGGGAPTRRRGESRKTPTSKAPVDPIQTAAGRIGGNTAAAPQAQEQIDIAKWAPLLREIARNPQASGPLTTTILTALTKMQREPARGHAEVIDMNAAEDAVRQAL